MEPAQLQLILNVIGITGVCSLASISYILWKDNRKLASQLTPEEPKTMAAVSLQAPLPVVPNAAPVVAPEPEKDIRCLAADRRAGWVEGLTSAMAFDR